MKFTHDLDIEDGWTKTVQIPSDFKEVKHLGKCAIDGDMFAAYNDQGEIHIFKGVLEEPLKTNTWYIRKHKSLLVYRTENVNNYGILDNDKERSYFNCFMPRKWREATEEEVKETLIELAKKKGFKNINELIIKDVYGEVFEKGFFITENNEFIFERNILSLDGVEIFEKGKWAEILKEETLKEDTWYRDKYTPSLVYRTGDEQNYGILENEESNYYSCSTPEYWQEATQKEVKETLVKLAKKKGFKNVHELRIKDPYENVYEKGDISFIDNNFKLIYGETLLLNGVIIFNKGKWAEILEEEPLTIEERLKRLEDKLNI